MDSELIGAILSLENDRERRPEIPFYQEDTWTPTWTNLTIVGAPTYSGTYVRIGRIVFFNVIISAGGANTTASTAGTTRINNLPLTAQQNGILAAANGSIVSYGNGLVSGGSTNAFTPTWAATNASVTISGFYFI